MRKSISALIGAAFAVMITALSVLPASAALPSEKRVALVIGNANYKNTVALPNTVNDARAMTQALQRLGFDVVSGVDLSREGMNRTMQMFARKLVGADVGLFFYAGHGMQVAGQNYLIPVDAALKHETDLEFEAVKINKIVDRMSTSARIKLVFLDSCRDNPLAQSLARSMSGVTRSMAPSSGLAAIQQAASGTMIAFATAPGNVALDGNGKNSPFTTALLDHIETPGLDIDVMMKRVRGQVARSTGERQQPWTNSALNGEFYMKAPVRSAAVQQPTKVAALTPAAGATAKPAAQAPTTARGLSDETRAQIDLAAWQFAHKNGSGTKSDYEGYLAAHPTGLFARQARDQILQLTSPSTPRGNTQVAALGSTAAQSPYAAKTVGTETTEKALGLSRNDWRRLQRQLNGLGFDAGYADGRPGKGTRGALSEWQAKNGYQATGYLDGGQRTALLVAKLPENVASTGNSSSKSSRRSVTRSKSSSRKSSRRSSSTKRSYKKKRRKTAKRRRSNGNSGVNAAVGAAIAIGAGIAIGRAMRR